MRADGVFTEWAEVDDSELLEGVVESTSRAVAQLCSARRAPAPAFVWLPDDSPLVSAVVAYVAGLA